MLREALYLLALAVTVDAQEKKVSAATDKTAQTAPVVGTEAPVVDTSKPLPNGPMAFTATAYSTKGNTVKGVQSQPGIVAADPKILPLGSTIKVSDAGKYSGMYVVTDVGTAIVGKRIDIFISEFEDAKAFGKKDVTVELVKPGDNVKFKPETTNVIPKSALAPAQKEEAAVIPSNKVPAEKPAVIEGRAVKAQEKAEEKQEKAKEKIEEAKRQ